MEIPPDCGNGLDNAGVPLAKLLFYLRERPLMTLIEVELPPACCRLALACACAHTAQC